MNILITLSALPMFAFMIFNFMFENNEYLVLSKNYDIQLIHPIQRYSIRLTLSVTYVIKSKKYD